MHVLPSCTGTIDVYNCSVTFHYGLKLLSGNAKMLVVILKHFVSHGYLGLSAPCVSGTCWDKKQSHINIQKHIRSN